MEIIAETTGGFLINGSTAEVKEILRAVQGTIPETIKIGQKIPAIDYAATITKLKQLPEEYAYKQLIIHTNRFTEFIDGLQTAVNNSTAL